MTTTLGSFSAFLIFLSFWFLLALILGILAGRWLGRIRRAYPIVRAAANDDFNLSSPPSRRRRARRGG